jgi:hypothetical protein
VRGRGGVRLVCAVWSACRPCQLPAPTPHSLSTSHSLATPLCLAQARLEACRDLLRGEWQYALFLGRAAAKARGPGWRRAALSLYAAACRLSAGALEAGGGGAAPGGGVLAPLVKLHGLRLRLAAEALGAAATAGGGGGSGDGGALELVEMAARHCFSSDAAAALAALPGASSGPGAGSATAVADAVRIIADDAVAALRWCQERYVTPGQLHAAAYRLARGLALLGR